jgi:hypothetical protein
MTFTPRRKKPSFEVKRVLSRLRSGSSLPVVVDTAAGRFVTKLRGAAQGPPALVAEVIVAGLAERLGLPVPERALIDLAADVETDDHNDELADLLRASTGDNLGFRWLEPASALPAAQAAHIADELALPVLWLDALVLNIDRTPANSNILMVRGQPWLIDHGASLGFQYDWASVDEDAPRAPVDHALHLFGTRSGRLGRYDDQLAARLSRAAIEAAVAQVPETFLTDRPPEWSPARCRAAYVAFLWKRLKAPRPFVG